MKRLAYHIGLLGLALCAGFSAHAEERLTLPSGHVVHLQEILVNQQGAEGLSSHFRFVAEAISQDEDWSQDMLHLCESYALAKVAGATPAPRQIVISVADQALPFGESAPDAVQFFEAYQPEGETCIWEVF